MTLVATVIRASEDAGREEGNNVKAPGSLTDNESGATSSCITSLGTRKPQVHAYAITLLARYPQWQDWLKMEVDQVFGSAEIDETQYQKAYPQMKRCLATMVSLHSAGTWSRYLEDAKGPLSTRHSAFTLL